MFYSDPASCCQDENHTSGGLFESNVFVKTLRVIYQGPKSADKSAPGAAKVKPGPAAVNKVASVSASMAAYTHMHVCWALDDKDHWAHDCDIVAVQYAWFTVVDMLDTNMDDDNSKWARGLLDIITAKIFVTPPTSKLVTRGKNGGLNCLPSRRKRQMAIQDDPRARARSKQASASVKGKTRERDTTPRRPVSSRAPLTPIQAPQLSPVQSGRSHSPDGETGRGLSASSPTPMPPPRHRVPSNETRSPLRHAAPNAPRAANSQRALPASATWSNRQTRSRTREASQPVASSSTVVASSGVSTAKRKHRD
ncbi:hypothetical protein PENSPDRAFT_683875 [Peniophora sp. CONT]|nr:hypothetical protein PENSPDRAFT_683875 [Peniophora sp. CONT]